MVLVLLTIIVAALTSIKAECELLNLPKHDHCRASIKCTEILTDISMALQSWDCIKHRIQYDYYDRYNNDYTYDSDYELDIELQNVDINKFGNPLIGLNNIGISNVKNLTIIEGNYVSVSQKIFELSSLRELVIVKTMIEKIRLQDLTYMSSLEKINASRNAISIIDDTEESKGDLQSVVHTIDLSYNELELIPDNCFVGFPRLLYLDLSHNLLNTIDILTFEGIRLVETLLLSHNKLSEIGLNFVRLKQLNKLILNHNNLKALNEINFKTLVNLQYLDVSFNQIKTIEKNSFLPLKSLNELDLRDNKLNMVSKLFFKNNTNLHKLLISNNYIDNLEQGVFEGKNISEFSIKGNCLSGSIEYHTFLGIHVEKLDLSGGRLRTIGDESLSDMGTELRYLNFSQNNLENISRICFSNLKLLTELDLSNNNLVEIEFESKDLKELRQLYLQNNRIKRISANMLDKLKSLIYLDISQNALDELEKKSFAELDNLETLLLNNNNLSFFGANVFTGLHKLKTLHISETKVMYLKNELFNGLISLEILNISRGQLEQIEYETFKGTGRIKILDISYNKLDIFTVNTSILSQVKELHLNHNQLKNITEVTFHKMAYLEILNLSENNIVCFHSKALQTLENLNFLYLSSNIHLKLESDSFNNLQFSEVSLTNIYNPFNFSRAKNVSITTLILSDCNISDIDLVFVYNIENLSKLILRLNNVTSIGKESLKNMPLLDSLDLSQNVISFIQPGTFLYCDMINILNLNENKLQTLQYGSLDGLKNLRILNLSSNAIHEINANLLHSTPRLLKLYLDNNDIININFQEFAETSITTLTIGQNPIACDKLISFKKYNFEKLNITANHFDFNTENVKGIPCINYFVPRKDKVIDTYNSTNELSVLKTTFDNVKKILSNTLNETTLISKSVRDVVTNLSIYNDVLTKELNKSQIFLEKSFLALLNKHDILRTQLLNSNNNVTDVIKAVEVSMKLTNNLSSSSNSLVKEQNEIIKRFYNKDKTVLSSQQYEKFQQDKSVRDVVDIKILLLVISVCVVIQILYIFSLLIHKYFIKNKRSSQTNMDLRVSNQPLNVMEME